MQIRDAILNDVFGEKISENIWVDNNGQLICANSVLARTGYYDYLESELFDGGSTTKVIKVYRSPEEVFAPEAIKSMNYKPLVNDHPEGNITPESVMQVSKGFMTNVRRGEGEFADCLIGDLIATDPEVIELIRTGGKRELSIGYTSDIVEVDGKWEMKNIRGNHVALCSAGRAGNAKIRDSKTFVPADDSGVKKSFANIDGLRKHFNDSSIAVEGNSVCVKRDGSKLEYQFIDGVDGRVVFVRGVKEVAKPDTKYLMRSDIEKAIDEVGRKPEAIWNELRRTVPEATSAADKPYVMEDINLVLSGNGAAVGDAIGNSKPNFAEGDLAVWSSAFGPIDLKILKVLTREEAKKVDAHSVSLMGSSDYVYLVEDLGVNSSHRPYLKEERALRKPIGDSAVAVDDTILEPGKTYTSKSGNKLKVQKVVSGISDYDGSPEIDIEYSYEKVDGKTGSSKCGTKEFFAMLNDSVVAELRDAEYEWNGMYINGTLREFDTRTLIESVKRRQSAVHTNRVSKDTDDVKVIYTITLRAHGTVDNPTSVDIDIVKSVFTRGAGDADDIRSYSFNESQSRVLAETVKSFEEAERVLTSFKSSVHDSAFSGRTKLSDAELSPSNIGLVNGSVVNFYGWAEKNGYGTPYFSVGERTRSGFVFHAHFESVVRAKRFLASFNNPKAVVVKSLIGVTKSEVLDKAVNSVEKTFGIKVGDKQYAVRAVDHADAVKKLRKTLADSEYVIQLTYGLAEDSWLGENDKRVGSVDKAKRFKSFEEANKVRTSRSWASIAGNGEHGLVKKVGDSSVRDAEFDVNSLLRKDVEEVIPLLEDMGYKQTKVYSSPVSEGYTFAKGVSIIVVNFDLGGTCVEAFEK